MNSSLPVNPSSERVNILGVGISPLNLESADEKLQQAVQQAGWQGFVTITGVHGVVESQFDEELKKVHNRSYLSTPDGMPMVWFGKWAGHSAMNRVYGPDLMLQTMERSVPRQETHYFYGGAEGVAQELHHSLASRFPGLEVAGVFTPPFRPFTNEEELALLKQIQEARPHYFWVGLSTPKQERFMHDFLAKYPDLSADWDHGFVMLGVGAAFDFHSGKVRQAPRWVQRSGFEWLFRVLMDPRRLWKRYLFAISVFLSRIIPQMRGDITYRMIR
ncbi:WecB/TagA/CpsF family glycosyltransferase [Roseibacillus ishigakijimensis]|uniref:WecB/TagA/CpsF family glycosyltransferase n=1 Tax=Roseibacillus ishigakijimensis TaxID=454146 RepID=A0A934RKJ0_9BACT|nr:WecB/TagA/CpsF family glycosyltransferase [Roseibacillus ishigakijimensis]MBK1833407.1 WecB/TagA/CpsF family glycosyltransferase [Roseibacillus ishigakijimensis]